MVADAADADDADDNVDNVAHVFPAWVAHPHAWRGGLSDAAVAKRMTFGDVVVHSRAMPRVTVVVGKERWEAAAGRGRAVGSTGEAVLCVGGPVCGVSWLPQERGVGIGGTAYRFLAVGAVPEGCKVHPRVRRVPDDALPAYVQVWAVPCGEDAAAGVSRVKREKGVGVDGDGDGRSGPVLCYAVGRPGAGRVRDVAWCPSFRDEAERAVGGSRLGLLCAAFGNGEVCVWAVPVPRYVDLEARRERPEGAEVCPPPSFAYRLANAEAYPTKVAWYPQAPHDRMLVGCSDGRVVLLGLQEGPGPAGEAECVDGDEGGGGGVGGDAGPSGSCLSTFEVDRDGRNRVCGLCWAPPSHSAGGAVPAEVSLFAASTEYESGSAYVWDIRDPSQVPIGESMATVRSCLTSLCWPSVDYTIYPALLGGRDTGSVALFSAGTKVPAHWLLDAGGDPLVASGGEGARQRAAIREVEVPLGYPLSGTPRRKRSSVTTLRTTRSAVLDVAIPRLSPRERHPSAPAPMATPLAYASACGNVAIVALQPSSLHVYARHAQDKLVMLASSTSSTSKYGPLSTAGVPSKDEDADADEVGGRNNDDGDDDEDGEDGENDGDDGGGRVKQESLNPAARQSGVKSEGSRIDVNPYKLDVTMQEVLVVELGGSAHSVKHQWREETAYKLDPKVPKAEHMVAKARDSVHCVAWGECPGGDDTARWLAHGGGAGLVRVQLCQVSALGAFHSAKRPKPRAE